MTSPGYEGPRGTVSADRPDGASSCEVGSAIGDIGKWQGRSGPRLTPRAISVCLTERSLEPQ
jgi:hypothetical protein